MRITRTETPLLFDAIRVTLNGATIDADSLRAFDALDGWVEAVKPHGDQRLLFRHHGEVVAYWNQRVELDGGLIALPGELVEDADALAFLILHGET